MDTHKALDAAKAALKRRADANGDGKLDMDDVEAIVAHTKSCAITQTQKHPIGAIATTAVLVGLIAFALGRAFGGC